jgi:hypothetical protein
MREWAIDTINDGDGTAVVIFYDVKGEDPKMLAQIYVDDYDQGYSQQYINLMQDINNLSDSIESVKTVLQDWSNGMDDKSPLVKSWWWDAGRI